LKLLVDADAWQISGQNETDILYFLLPSHPPCLKNVAAPLAVKKRMLENVRWKCTSLEVQLMPWPISVLKNNYKVYVGHLNLKTKTVFHII